MVLLLSLIHIEKAQAMGIWQENDAYVPQIGDIIMYDWDDNGNGDNTGWPCLLYTSKVPFLIVSILIPVCIVAYDLHIYR